MTSTLSPTGPATTDHLRPLLDRLTLEDKVALVRGADFWTTVALPHIGLRAMTLSDGPAGVRGPVWDERSPSLNLPSATALASSWDLGLARRYGAVAAAEARRKGVDVVLAPTINLHRTPLGGRHFECFSEDPLLSGELAAAYVRGLQENGVAATPKHYVANDSETDRFIVDVRMDERALRELYLLPFEHAVEAGAWAMMSGYNAVDGVTMSENDLLETPLNSEWGFDGVVISDWTAVRSLDSAPAAQDLAMPGPAPAWAELADAVREGLVSETDLDRKVLRLLLLAERVGALGHASPVVIAPADGRSFAREAATAGAVLLKNDGELPWRADLIGSVAVIGHNAREPRTQGGGSATVLPDHVVSPLDGIRAALPHARIDHALGAVVQEGVAAIPLERITNPVSGEPGVRVSFRDAEGRELFAEDRRSTTLVWFGGDAPIGSSETAVLTTVYTPDASGQIELGFATAKHGRVFVDGELVLDDQPLAEGSDLGAAFIAPPSTTVAIDVQAGIALELRAEFDLGSAAGELTGAFSTTLGFAPDGSDPDTMIAEAAELARAADVAVVVVGTNAKVESEGFDREDLSLPGRQDDLVRAVIAANPRTVVIVNAGAPVILPWRDSAAAVLLSWFGGQEIGAAVADILTGEAEPRGRLTTTWPDAVEDAPVIDVVPVDGRLEYVEGIHMGYRAWLRAAAEPAYPFGFGLGYTTWSFDAINVAAGGADDTTVTVTITNTGGRAGSQIVQLYAERPDSLVERPARWLIGFAVARADAGKSTTVRIAVPRRRLAHWGDGAWHVEPGTFVFRAGSDVVTLPLATTHTAHA